MINNEIIDWFNNYFDNCYYVKHEDYPESIFMYYDVNYVRKLKLAQLDDKIIEKTEVTGICLFEQDWKNKWFGCNYDLIWCYLRDNYSFNHGEFDSFIKDRLKEQPKISVLIPNKLSNYIYTLVDYSKMSILTRDNLFRST